MKRSFCYFMLFFSFAISYSKPYAHEYAHEYWVEFRKAFPNPYQTIGFKRFDDNSLLFILSEPPEFVLLSQVEDVFGGLLYEIDIKKWSYGYDGWVKDLVITIEPTSEEIGEELIHELNSLMYGSSTQSIVLNLPVENKRKLFLDSSLNLQVTDNSLYTWFIKENMSFQTLDGSELVFTDIMSEIKENIYWSSTPGFIIWTIPINSSFSFIDPYIRLFTLNGDIIIGAISSSTTICLIAREREVDILDSPPLRMDELCNLINAPSQLSQSLNITDLLFGKLANNYDWCPAYLSDELENTEVGHILTLTDIFLKDWLSGRNYSYDDYHYPKPTTQCPENLKKILDERSTHYNWNLNGLLSKTNFNEYNIISIRNTGCLNCSLFDSSEINEVPLEDKEANNYLAELNNVDLFRAAQYIIIYTILKNHGITCENCKHLHVTDKSQILLGDAQKVIQRLSNLTPKDISNISKIIAEEKFEYYSSYEFEKAFENESINYTLKWEEDFKSAAISMAQKEGENYVDFQSSERYKLAKIKSDNYLKSHLEELKKNAKNKAIDDLRLKYVKDLNDAVNTINAIPKDEIDGFAQYCANPNGKFSHNDLIKYQGYMFNINKTNILFYYNYIDGINKDSIKNHYLSETQKMSGRWNKTPKIVLLNNNKDIYKLPNGVYSQGTSIGGHTITTKITPATVHSDRVQDQESISKYRGKYYKGYIDSTSPALESALEAAIIGAKSSGMEASKHARNSRWLLSNYNPTDKKSSYLSLNIETKIEREIANRTHVIITSEEIEKTKIQYEDLNREYKSIKDISIDNKVEGSFQETLNRFGQVINNLNPDTKLSQKKEEKGINEEDDLNLRIKELRKQIARAKKQLQYLKENYSKKSNK